MTDAATDGADTPKDAGRERPQTGDPQVDEANALLDGLDELPVDEHARVYDQVDSMLREVLRADSSGEATAPDSPTSA